MTVWINGSFFEEQDAKIGVFDAGFQHGAGLFETMLAKNGSLFRPRQHLERLANSASALRLTEKLQTEPLVEALQKTLEENLPKKAVRGKWRNKKDFGHIYTVVFNQKKVKSFKVG